MNKRIIVTYRNGVLVPKSPLSLKDNIDIEIVLSDRLFDAFSVAGKDDDVEVFFAAQKEVVEDE
ncbi:hypothetical protein CMI38_06460 [Candidatus Pacearchaeota archaeon]|jgi:predicted DNA-binding antitoxin AbrB/MazE fold protein|nr:hypothetical protein [Candidatus Pacearchaeota archaeon]|tara:strand:- start:886 stop:1077 length:192 start_codon:yes stop_codon:yes gene_type:complete